MKKENGTAEDQWALVASGSVLTTNTHMENSTPIVLLYVLVTHTHHNCTKDDVLFRRMKESSCCEIPSSPRQDWH